MVKNFDSHRDGDGSSPILCCETWFLDSESDPVIFLSVCWPPCVPATWLVALPACWLACRLAGRAESGVVCA